MSKPRIRAAQLALIVSVVLVLALILPLIGNVDRIPLLPGRGFDVTMGSDSGGAPPDAPGWKAITLLIRVLLIIAIIGLVVSVIVNRHMRRMYIILTLVFGAAFLILHFVGTSPPAPEQGTQVQAETDQELPIAQHIDQPQVQQDTESSNVLYIMLAVVLSSVAVGAGAMILVRWMRNRPQATDDGRDDILESITDAARRLRAGDDPYEVVLFCYQEMIRILSAMGKIDATYLTPREFERRLRGIGLSGEHTAQLTGIFEIVRYGGRVDDGFAARALACLEAIQEAHTHDDES